VKEFRVQVLIKPREGLLDPQGKAVLNALHALDFRELSDARVGRLIRLRVSAADAAAARNRVTAMCQQLLANPVTEDFTIEMEEQG